jgi:hypothetical protein
MRMCRIQAPNSSAKIFANSFQAAPNKGRSAHLSCNFSLVGASPHVQ